MKFLRLWEMQAKLGLNKSSIYRLIQKGMLEPPIKIGSSSVWLESSVEARMKKMLSDNGQSHQTSTNYGGN